MLLPLVIPQLCPHNLRMLQLLHGTDHINKPKAFPFQLLDAAPHITAMLANDPLREIPLRTRPIPLQQKFLRQIQYNSRRMHILLPGHLQHLCPGALLQVGGIHHRQLPVYQPLSRRVIQQVKRLGRNILAILVVTDHPPEKIRRQHLCRFEKPVGKAGLTGGCGSHHGDQAQLRNLYPKRFPL